MLVLNTTSPVASPSAPAAWPRNTVPSSRARIASTLLSVLCAWRFVLGPSGGSLSVVSPPSWVRTRDLGPRTDPAPRTKHQGPSSLQRRGNPVPFRRDDADRGGPATVAVALQTNHVTAGRYLRQRKWSRARELVVEIHLGAGRLRLDDDVAAEPADRRRRRRHRSRRQRAVRRGRARLRQRHHDRLCRAGRRDDHLLL